MIALIYQLGPALFQLSVVFALSIVLLVLAGRAKSEYRKHARLAALVAGCAAVWGVFHFQSRSMYFEWEQEVRLNDGSTIWIKRKTIFGHFGELAQIDRAKSLGEDIEFVDPKTGDAIQWKGEFDLEPLLIDFDQGTPYLATNIKPGKHYAWGCPPHPYAFFKFVNGKWQRIGIKSFPTRFERSNIFPYLDESTRKTLDTGAHQMDFAAVERKFRPPMPDAVRSIDRRIVNPIFFCGGTDWVQGPGGKIRAVIPLDEIYGDGTLEMLRKRSGGPDSYRFLGEQEASKLGILNLGDDK